MGQKQRIADWGLGIAGWVVRLFRVGPFNSGRRSAPWGVPHVKWPDPGDGPPGLRMLASPEGVNHWSLSVLRDDWINYGAKIVCPARYVTFQIRQVAVSSGLTRAILGRIQALAESKSFLPAGWIAPQGDQLRARLQERRTAFCACQGVRSCNIEPEECARRRAQERRGA